MTHSDSEHEQHDWTIMELGSGETNRGVHCQ